MDLQIKWLKDFLQLSQTLSFSQAAQLRHVSQPAFSRRIQALENHLNCKLVDRLAQPIKLTEQGILFTQTCQQVLISLEQGVSQVNPYYENDISLNFAATHTLSIGVFPALLQHIDQLPRKVSCKLKIADADDCVELLTLQQCDYLLAFSDPLLAAHQQDSLLLAKVKLLPVCKADSSGQAIYTLDNSNKSSALPYLAYQRNIFLGREVEQLIKKNRAQANIKKNIESSMADGLKMMALKGLGIAWIPEFSIQSELSNKQLAICGAEHWQAQLEVRIYRNKRTKKSLEFIWQSLSNVVI